MNEDRTSDPDAEPWAPSRGVRIVGLLSGVGATGITVGLGLIGTFLPVDLGLPILVAPLVIVPGLAGAVLRGRAAVAAITASAIASPIGAIRSERRNPVVSHFCRDIPEQVVLPGSDGPRGQVMDRG